MAARVYMAERDAERDASAVQRNAEAAESSVASTVDLGSLSDVDNGDEHDGVFYDSSEPHVRQPRQQQPELAAMYERMEHTLFSGVGLARGLPADWLEQCRSLFARPDEDKDAKLTACAVLVEARKSLAGSLAPADATAFCRNIAAALRTYLADVEFQHVGLVTLYVMRACSGFDQETALDALLLVQREHVRHHELQERIMIMMTLFARDNAEMAIYLVQAGALENCAACMQAHSQSFAIQLHAIDVAHILFAHVPANVSFGGIIEALCACFRAHKKCPAVVVRYGFDLLGMIAVRSPWVDETITALVAGAECVIDVLELYGPYWQPGSEHRVLATKVLAACWTFLCNLVSVHHSVLPANLVELLIPRAVAVLRAVAADFHTGSAVKCATTSCLFLRAVCVRHDRASEEAGRIGVVAVFSSQKVASECGAVEALAGVANLCAGTPLHGHVCSTCLHLIRSNKENRDAAWAYGLAQVLLRQLPQIGDDNFSHEHELAICLLGTLAEDPEFGKRVAEVENAAVDVVLSLGLLDPTARNDPETFSLSCAFGLRVLHQLLDTQSFERLHCVCGEFTAHVLWTIATMMQGADGDEFDAQLNGCRLILELTKDCSNTDRPGKSGGHYQERPVDAVISTLRCNRNNVKRQTIAFYTLAALLSFFCDVDAPIDIVVMLDIVQDALQMGKPDVICALSEMLDALMLSPEKLNGFHQAAPRVAALLPKLFDHAVLITSAGKILVELVRSGSCTADVCLPYITRFFNIMTSRCSEDARAAMYGVLAVLVDRDTACADAALSAGFLRLPKSKQPCTMRIIFESRLKMHSEPAVEASEAAAAALLADEEAEAANRTARPKPKKSKPKKKKASRSAAAASAEAAGSDAESADGGSPVEAAAPDTPPSQLETVGSPDVEVVQAENDAPELSQSESAVRRRRRAAAKAARRADDSSPDAAASAAQPAAAAAADDAALLAAEGFTAVARGKKRGGKKASSVSDADAGAPPAPPAPPAPVPPRPRSPRPAMRLTAGAPPTPLPVAGAAPPSPPAVERAAPAMPSYLLSPPPRAELQPLGFSAPASLLPPPAAALLQLPSPTPMPAEVSPAFAATSPGSVLPPPAAPSIFDALDALFAREACTSPPEAAAPGLSIFSSLTEPTALTPRPDASASGLSNAAGEYNCFLNSIVQALFHVHRFRNHLLGSRLLPRPSNLEQERNIALVRALGDLFEALNHGVALRRDAVTAPAAGDTRGVVAPTVLRQALADLSAAGGEGAMNAMADAAEVLSALCDAFQAVSAANRPGVPPAETSIGRMFGISVREAAHCSAAGCGKITHSISYGSFCHIVPSTALREAHARARKSPPSFERLLARLQSGDTKSCDKEMGGCGAQARVQHKLMQAPEVFTISLAWDTAQAAEDVVAATMKALRPELQPAKMFDGAPRSAAGNYELRAMVCYYGSHYAAYARTDDPNAADSRAEWTRFDDASVTRVGGWDAVCDACARGHLQPTVMFYERPHQLF